MNNSIAIFSILRALGFYKERLLQSQLSLWSCSPKARKALIQIGTSIGWISNTTPQAMLCCHAVLTAGDWIGSSFFEVYAFDLLHFWTNYVPLAVCLVDWSLQPVACLAVCLIDWSLQPVTCSAVGQRFLVRSFLVFFWADLLDWWWNLRNRTYTMDGVRRIESAR